MEKGTVGEGEEEEQLKGRVNKGTEGEQGGGRQLDKWMVFRRKEEANRWRRNRE